MALPDFEASIDQLGKWPYACMYLIGYIASPRPKHRRSAIFWRPALQTWSLLSLIYSVHINFKYAQHYRFWSTLLSLDLTIDIIAYTFMAWSLVLFSLFFKLHALFRPTSFTAYNSEILNVIQDLLTSVNVTPSPTTEAFLHEAINETKRRSRTILAFTVQSALGSIIGITFVDEATADRFFKYRGDLTLLDILQSMLLYAFTVFLHSAALLWYTYNIQLIHIALSLLIDWSKSMVEAQENPTKFKEIQELVRMAKRLETFVDDFNNRFGGFMLADFGVYFLTWLVYSYYMFYWVQFDDSRTIAGVLLFCLNFYYAASMLVAASSSMTSKFKDLGAAVGDLRHRLKKYGFKHGVEVQLKCLSIKFEGHPPAIAPWDFGSADRTVVVQVFGALTTYLVILVQFRNDVFNPQNSSVNSTTVDELHLDQTLS